MRWLCHFLQQKAGFLRVFRTDRFVVSGFETGSILPVTEHLYISEHRLATAKRRRQQANLQYIQ